MSSEVAAERDIDGRGERWCGIGVVVAGGNELCGELSGGEDRGGGAGGWPGKEPLARLLLGVVEDVSVEIGETCAEIGEAL